MATVTQIREGLRARLDTIAGLRAFAYMPDQVVSQSVVVRPGIMPEQEAMGLGNRYQTFELWLVGYPLQNGVTLAEKHMDQFLDETGATSPIAALNADKTLGGTVTTLTISRRAPAGYVIPQDSGAAYMVTIFDVTVWFS